MRLIVGDIRLTVGDVQYVDALGALFMTTRNTLSSNQYLAAIPASLAVAADYLASKPEARCDMPFGEGAWVFKVADKMFALLYQRQGEDCLNLKCDPQQALELRDVFESVTAGYHMNKRHWNTIYLGGDVPAGEVERMIDHSYALVYRGLTKAKQREFAIRYTDQQLLGEAG